MSEILVASYPCSELRSEERRVGKECRSLCDWSPDICSSDLGRLPALEVVVERSPGDIRPAHDVRDLGCLVPLFGGELGERVHDPALLVQGDELRGKRGTGRRSGAFWRTALLRPSFSP